MVLLGAHVSIRGGLHKSFDEAEKLGINAFQIFTRNPRGWKFKELDEKQVLKFKQRTKESKINQVISHMPYLPNLCAPEKTIFEKSVDSLKAELHRSGILEIPYVVIHIGHHKGNAEIGWKRFTNALEQAFEVIPKNVMLLVENSAGEKNSIGNTPEELKRILDAAENVGGDKHNFGFCFDTCHAHVSGLDLSTPESFAEVLDKFDEEIGLDRIKVVHLNDAKAPAGSGLDRHENIGDGTIGLESFKFFLNETKLAKRVPLILETPIKQGGKTHKDDLKILRSIIKK